jgi:glc operon protein GlcG
MVAGGRTAILGVPGVVPIEGGLPLVVDGQFIGAIGVSGGTAQQDGQVAKAGVEAMNQ